MCQLCVDAIEKHWPDLPEDKYNDLLICATSWPCGDGEHVASQVKEKAEQSGQNFNLALAIADAEMHVCMAQGKLDDLLKEGKPA